MSAGKTYLTGERGPELVTPNVASKVTSNANLANTFDLKPLENKMSNTILELTNANKTLASILLGLNTSVAVQNRTRKATEDGVRATKSITGSVLV